MTETDEWEKEEYIDLTENGTKPIATETRIRPRPPVSAPAPSTSKTRISTSEKPRSAIGMSSSQKREESKVEEESEGQECPICGTKLTETDKDKVNAHIDDCLSRSAIREAQREDTGVGQGSPSKKGGWEWFLEGQRTAGSSKKGKKKRH
ncbi:hypothetical protein K435DRAFT_133901 [Dendrothele bispora CBS 962.96]|uniref:UBZ4-type domain-containing protein n=1 Tax=Dendrothele bispora (strain CBS 962.96) TaxID=1314807 RepID=A0A4S8MPR3_DENBC|nr:hypothetical protein K435DRAFT_133901 [Dendrothele bispora CBS 962.96]